MMRFRAALAWMVLMLLAASVVRFHDLDRQSIWFDEGWSAYAASQPTLLDAARADLTNPPLYYILLNVSVAAFGRSEYVLRWLSSALNLLTIALLYVLARDLFYRRAGVYAAAIAGFSALLWWASQEARMYTLLALFVTLAALAWHRLLTRPSRATWLVLWTTELCLLYSHNTGPISAIWLNIVTFIAWITLRSLRRPNWRVWLIGQIGVFVLWLPWLDIFLDVSEANAAISSAPSLSPLFMFEVWQGLVVGNWSMIRSLDSEAVIISLISLPVVLFGIPWRNPHARWLLLHFILLIGGVIVGLVILGNEYHGRYAVLAMPLLLATIGAGIARLRYRVVKWGVLLFIIVGFVVIAFVARQPIYGNDDVRGMVQHYAKTLSEDDAVLAWSYADRYDLWYYWDHLGVRAQRITLPEGAEMDEIVPMLPADGAVSINVWYTQRADYRGMLPCLIGHLTSRVPSEFTTYGMTDLHFDQRSPALPRVVETLVPFAADGVPVANIVQVGQLAETRADQAICVPIAVQAQQPISSELSLALIVRNPLGWEIARSDAIIATSDQRTVLANGETAAAYPFLRLPYGAPPGEYEVFVRLYNAQAMPFGYFPAESLLRTSGRDVRVGIWRVSESPDWVATGRAPDGGNFERVIADNLRLVNRDIDATSPLRNGDSLRISLLWEGASDLPHLTMRDSEGRWEIAVPPSQPRVEGVMLDWRHLRVPNDAPDGEALLSLPDGTELARFMIQAIPVLTEPPPTSVALGARFPSVGTLVGYGWGQEHISLASAPEIELVWRADTSGIPVDYTVFVQLLNADGAVIAQNDSMPAQGARPTSGWREGEYIVDRHRLTYNGLARPGVAQLIVGWYDASTNRRVVLEHGADALVLGTVEVKPIISALDVWTFQPPSPIH